MCARARVCLFYHHRSIIFHRRGTMKKRSMHLHSSKTNEKRSLFSSSDFYNDGTQVSHFITDFLFRARNEKWRKTPEQITSDDCFWHCSTRSIIKFQSSLFLWSARWTDEQRNRSVILCKSPCLAEGLSDGGERERCKSTHLHYHTCCSATLMMSSKEDQTRTEKQVMFRYLTTINFQVELW